MLHGDEGSITYTLAGIVTPAQIELPDEILNSSVSSRRTLVTPTPKGCDKK